MADTGYFAFAEQNRWVGASESIGRSLWGEESIEMCAWCDRFRVEGEWMEVEAASRALGLTTASELPGISHSLCDRCAGMLEGA